MLAEPLGTHIAGIGVLGGVQVYVVLRFLASSLLSLVKAVYPALLNHPIPPLVSLSLFVLSQPIKSFAEERLGVAIFKPIRQCTSYLLSLQGIDGGVEANVEQDQRMDISPHITIRLLQSIIRSLLADGWVETGLNICVHSAK